MILIYATIIKIIFLKLILWVWGRSSQSSTSFEPKMSDHQANSGQNHDEVILRVCQDLPKTLFFAYYYQAHKYCNT